MTTTVVMIPDNFLGALVEHIYQFDPELEWGELGYPEQRKFVIATWMHSRGRFMNPITATDVVAELQQAELELVTARMGALAI